MTRSASSRHVSVKPLGFGSVYTVWREDSQPLTVSLFVTSPNNTNKSGLRRSASACLFHPTLHERPHTPGQGQAPENRESVAWPLPHFPEINCRVRKSSRILRRSPTAHQRGLCLGWIRGKFKPGTRGCRKRHGRTGYLTYPGPTTMSPWGWLFTSLMSVADSRCCVALTRALLSQGHRRRDP
jgi:hypothetical protein